MKRSMTASRFARALMLIVPIVLGCDVTPRPSGPPKPVVEIDKSPAMQTKRDKLIDEVIRSGLVLEIQHDGTVARTVLGRGWNDLDFADKQQLAEIIYARYCEGLEGDLVRFVDGKTNKVVARFGPQYRGLMLN